MKPLHGSLFVLALLPVLPGAGWAATVTGRVADGTGRPVPAAQVFLFPQAGGPARPPVRATTDAAGRFQAERLPEGHLAVRVEARGYLPAALEGIEIRPAKVPRDLGTILLDSESRIAGVVIDPAGTPLGGVEVYTDLPGRAPGPGAVTGKDGWFVLGGLRATDVVSLDLRRSGYAPAEVPQVSAAANAVLSVILQPAIQLAGIVVDEDGEPLAGASVALREDEGAGRMLGTVRSGKDGRFKFSDRSSGTYRLTAALPGLRPSTLKGIELAAGGGGDDLEITLERGSATIEGTVFDSSGAPVPGARVQVVGSSGDAALAGFDPPRTVADEDGSYRLTGLEAGEVTVQAEGSGGLPAEATLQAERGANRLDLHLRDGASLSGRALTAAGEPVEGVEILLVPLDADGRAPLPVRSEAGGHFRFTRVAAGRYLLRGGSEGYTADPREVRVEEAPVSGADLVVRRGGAVAGTLRGLTSGELLRVEVRASAPGERRDHVTRALADGRYRIDGLGPGRWRVLAQIPESSRAASSEVWIPEGRDETPLDLDFGAGCALTGRVENAGLPVAGAWVTLRQGDGARSVATGADGAFRIEGLDPGIWTVAVSQPVSGARWDGQVRLEAAESEELRVKLGTQ